jgi:hypothetical protein
MLIVERRISPSSYIPLNDDAHNQAMRDPAGASSRALPAVCPAVDDLAKPSNMNTLTKKADGCAARKVLKQIQ